jgi:hypothetical protein
VEFYKELSFDVTAPETEAPTDPETTPETEPETTVSDTETQEDTTPATEAPTEGDTVQETDPPQKGCGSSLIGVSTLAVTAAAALTLRKRKED